MEKLIELLNEYKKLGKYKEYWYNGKQVKLIEYAEDYAESTSEDITEKIISKKFGFIKWLVDNDKIDLYKLDEKAERKPQYAFTDDDGRLGFKLFEVYESLLMLLSIQDNPIDFLISILKDKKVRTVYVDKDGNVSGDTKRYTDC